MGHLHSHAALLANSSFKNSLLMKKANLNLNDKSGVIIIVDYSRDCTVVNGV